MEGYKYRVENTDIDSCDCSMIENAHIKNGDLLLKIDQFLYTDKEKSSSYPCKEDCLLILEKFTLIDEQAGASQVPLDRRMELERYAANQKLDLYLSFEDFLKSSTVEVQSFEFDWNHQYLTIIGYDSEEKAALWCDLKFQFNRIVACWNKEKVW